MLNSLNKAGQWAFIAIVVIFIVPVVAAAWLALICAAEKQGPQFRIVNCSLVEIQPDLAAIRDECRKGLARQAHIK